MMWKRVNSNRQFRMTIKLVIFSIFLVFVAGNTLDDRVDSEKKIVRRLDEIIESNDQIKIFGDIVTINKVKDSPVEEGRTNRKESDVLISKIQEFLDSRKIHIQFPDDGSAVDMFGRALGRKSFDIELRGLSTGASEARTRIKKMLLPILLALKLKSLIVLPIVITIIGLVGINGLGVGLAALLLAGAVSLKALLTPPLPHPARVSYGIIKPEIYHEHWHRSQEEVNEPYRGWSPELNLAEYPYQS